MKGGEGGLDLSGREREMRARNTMIHIHDERENRGNEEHDWK